MTDLKRLLDNLIQLTKSGKIKWRSDVGYNPSKFFLSTPSFRIVISSRNDEPNEFIIRDEEGNIMEYISITREADSNTRNMLLALIREINQKIEEKRKISLDKLIGEVVQLGNK